MAPLGTYRRETEDDSSLADSVAGGRLGPSGNRRVDDERRDRRRAVDAERRSAAAQHKRGRGRSRRRLVEHHRDGAIFNAGRLTLARFVDLTSAGPARLFNIACKGRIAAGYDADFTIVDLKRSETITNQWVASKAGWTPYDGMRVTGWPVGTFVRGKRAMWQGEVTTPSTGEPVRFLETLKA